MPGVNLVAVVAATIAAFVLSSAWYIVFGKARMELIRDSGATADVRKTPAWKLLVELARSFLFAYVLARVIVLAGVRGWSEGLKFGLLVWVGFPFMILSGSVIWDRVPSKLAAIHVGDWFVKVVALAVILALWR